MQQYCQKKCDFSLYNLMKSMLKKQFTPCKSKKNISADHKTTKSIIVFKIKYLSGLVMKQVNLLVFIKILRKLFKNYPFWTDFYVVWYTLI